MTRLNRCLLFLVLAAAYLGGPPCMAACALGQISQADESHSCCPDNKTTPTSPLADLSGHESCRHEPQLSPSTLELLQKPKPYTGIFPDNLMQPYETRDIPWIATQEDIGRVSFYSILRPFFLQHHQWLC